MSPLRRRDFRLVLVAIGVSALGDVIGLIPLALHVHDTTGSGLAVSALFIAMWGPIVVAAGLAGRLADRVESRALVLWVSLAQAVVVAGLAFATGSLAAVLVLTALLGLGTAIGAPAEFALVPVAAGEDQLAVANGHVETVRYAGLTAGPLVGGLLAAIGATRAALLIDAASFLVVAASVGRYEYAVPDTAASEPRAPPTPQACSPRSPWTVNSRSPSPGRSRRSRSCRSR